MMAKEKKAGALGGYAVLSKGLSVFGTLGCKC
jgi:hypothetical protein